MTTKKNKSFSSIENDDIKIAKSILKQEASALEKLSVNIDQNFSKAVDFILNVNGRIILSGIGKSGHIARKISSTMSSTGTPSFFLHPSEASHGDLGMIASNDAIILLSKSGESIEFNDLIEIAQKQSIPLIAISSKLDSTISKASSVVLKIPEIPEACPLGLAPTTSSTMMLALGDALSVALLERKKFTIENFKNLHPGGKLGKALLKVEDLMHGRESLPTVNPSTLMSEVLIVMSSKNFGCACVIDENDMLIGVITDGDLRRHMKDGLLNLQASSIMTKSPKIIAPSDLLVQAIEVMAGSITNLFVVKDGKVLGILRLHDCLRIGMN